MSYIHPLPRFHLSGESPCAYLENATEQRIYTYLDGTEAQTLHEVLAQHGFRRNQNIAYRPHCGACAACQSLRVCAQDFTPSRTQQRIWQCNSRLQVQLCDLIATQEQYELFKHYISKRHAQGGMNHMDELDYADMLESSPVETYVVEYRAPSRYGEAGELLGVCITDAQKDGLSLVYSFFNPDSPYYKSLGCFIILEHIARAQSLGLPYVYLGFYIKTARSMAYKGQYKPHERLIGGAWVRNN
jgi:leucyl-tRNA---protein transferase